MASIEPPTAPRAAVGVTIAILLAIAVGAAYLSERRVFAQEEEVYQPSVTLEHVDVDRPNTTISIMENVQWLGHPIFVPVGAECTAEDPCTPTIFRGIECGFSEDAGILVCRTGGDIGQD